VEALRILRERVNTKHGYNYTDNDYQKLLRGPCEIYDHQSLALNGITFKTQDADGNTIATYCNVMYHEQADVDENEENSEDQSSSSSSTSSSSSSSSSIVRPSKKRKPRPARQVKESKQRIKRQKKVKKLSNRSKSPVQTSDFEQSEDDDDDDDDDDDEEEEEEEGDDGVVHLDYCSVCGDGGNLLMCDGPGCNRSYHLECAKLEAEPVGDFICDHWYAIRHSSIVYIRPRSSCVVHVVRCPQ